MTGAVVEGAEVAVAGQVVLQLLAVVQVAVPVDVAVAERKAEGIVVRRLQDGAAVIDDGPYAPQMVRDVVLRRVRPRAGNLPVYRRRKVAVVRPRLSVR